MPLINVNESKAVRKFDLAYPTAVSALSPLRCRNPRGWVVDTCYVLYDWGGETFELYVVRL